MGKLDDLVIHKKSLSLIEQIYLIVNQSISLRKDFSLSDRIKRSSVSVATNIAEGYYRNQKQSHNYLRIAAGSANETATLLEIIYRVYKLNCQKLKEDYLYLAKQISAFAKSFTS